VSTTLKVSVITPVHDRERLLPVAVDSVLAQDYPSLEHIVVDDGSTDGTAAAAARYGDRIRYVRQENAGPSAARNRALSMARGEYVAFLDSDDAWRPGRLARQIPMLDANPRAGLLYAAIDYVDADGNPSPVRKSRRGTPSGFILPTLVRHNVMETSTVIVRRALVEEAGGFDPRFRWNEDLDLWLKVCLRHEALYDPVPSVLQRRHPGQLIADHVRLGEALVEVLEGNLERLRRDAPEFVPVAARALAEVRLRRAGRRFREGRREEAEAEVAAALRAWPRCRAKAALVRLRGRLGGRRVSSPGKEGA
jgi:glycosyltransferase involved in cell wall biosynthesis